LGIAEIARGSHTELGKAMLVITVIMKSRCRGRT
jgi:hypothetical protein